MAVPMVQHKGVTPPISVSLPTDIELSANDALVAELKAQNNFEGPEETERRYAAQAISAISIRLANVGCPRKTTLQLIQRVTVAFVRTVSQKKGLPPNLVSSAGGKIFTYGSYRLGVYGPGIYLIRFAQGSAVISSSRD